MVQTKKTCKTLIDIVMQSKVNARRLLNLFNAQFSEELLPGTKATLTVTTATTPALRQAATKGILMFH